MKGTRRCNLCQWVTQSNAVRRRLKHVVGVGTSVRACSKVSTADPNLVATVKEDLCELRAERQSFSREEEKSCLCIGL